MLGEKALKNVNFFHMKKICRIRKGSKMDPDPDPKSCKKSDPDPILPESQIRIRIRN